MSRKKRRYSEKIRNGIGPFSNVDRLLLVDRRTRLGKFMHETRESLLDHVGPNPSVPQQIIVHQAVIKLTRLILIEGHILSNDGIEQGDRHQWAAWSNSLRRDLEALGMERRLEEAPSLYEYLASREAPR